MPCVAAGVVLLALGGSHVAIVSTAEGHFCRAAIQHRGSTYFKVAGIPRRLLRPPVGRYATAVVSNCGRTQPPESRVRVYRIRGVHPAVAVQGGDGTAYLAWGFVPQVPGYPLADAVASVRSVPTADPADFRACTRHGIWTARVDVAPNAVQTMKVELPAGETVPVVISPDTHVLGRRLRLPYAQPGGLVDIRGVRCQRRDQPEMILASEIRRIAPSIILNRGIQGIYVGMADDEVKTRLGLPDVSRRLVRSYDSYAIKRWTFVRERLRVEIGEYGWWPSVVAVETTNSSHRTREGLGVGSTEATLRQYLPKLICWGSTSRRNCAVFRPRSPDVRTLFVLQDGVVTRVRIDVRPAPA